MVSVFGAPPVPGIGMAGGFKLMVEDRGDLGLPALQNTDRRPDRSGPQAARPDRRVHACSAPIRRSFTWTSTATKVRVAGRHGQRRQPDLADLPRLVLRQQLQRVRPLLAGQRPGRRRFSRSQRAISTCSRSVITAGRWCRSGTLVDVRDVGGPVMVCATTSTRPPRSTATSVRRSAPARPSRRSSSGRRNAAAVDDRPNGPS